MKMVEQRYLEASIEALCFPSHKMAFISGPRQCGKTTCAKRMLKNRGQGDYFNWDEKRFRIGWTKNPLLLIQESLKKDLTGIPLVILDEIHKAKFWKRDLKGIYDSLDSPVDLLVTGSAKLDVYRRGSDSLLGRYHHFRLHPFSLGELLNNIYSLNSNDLLSTVIHPHEKIILLQKNQKISEYFSDLWDFGPFPEPLFSKNKALLNLWHRERLERLIREDLRDLSRIQELSQIEMLVSLLPERAANVLSITALRKDLEVAHSTMKLWIHYLKHIYYLFEIKPYHHALARSLKKEGKIYLWDWSEIENPGARFENLIACHLFKFADYLSDIGEAKVELHYLKNKEKQEIDFLLVKDKKPWLPIEVKLSQETLSEHWPAYFKKLPCKQGIQVIKPPGISRKIAVGEGEVWLVSAEFFLALLP